MTGLRPPAIRRIAALTILAALVLMLCAAAWPMIALVRDRLAAIGEIAQRVERAEASAAQEPQLRRRVRDGRAELAATGGMWSGTTPAAMAASIEDRLRKAVVAAGGRVDSVAELGEAKQHGFRRIALRFAIEGTLDTVVKTLSAIEAARPALFADDLTIAATAAPSDRAAAPSFHLDLEVAGYLGSSGS